MAGLSGLFFYVSCFSEMIICIWSLCFQRQQQKGRKNRYDDVRARWDPLALEGFGISPFVFLLSHLLPFSCSLSSLNNIPVSGLPFGS